MEDLPLAPTIFFETVRLRELLLRAGRPVSTRALARFLKVEARDLVVNLSMLARVGLAVDKGRGFELTEEGAASVRWSAPPPPNGIVSTWWVTDLARALADYYDISVSQMLRDMHGPPVVARSRLCFALYARGWALERIEEHFALPPGWARRAVERWKRLRDQNVPKTGAELIAWRLRLGLTQTQAAEMLGVNRRTIQRAEKSGTFSFRTAIGRA